MAWKFREHVRIEQNDFTKSFYAIVALTDGVNDESVRLKFREKPTPKDILAALQPQIDARNYIAPVTDEDRLKTRIEKLTRDGVTPKRMLDKLAEIV